MTDDKKKKGERRTGDGVRLTLGQVVVQGRTDTGETECLLQLL